MNIKYERFGKVKNPCTRAAKNYLPTPPWNMRVPICLPSPAVHCSISPHPLARDSGGCGGWKGVSEVPHLGDKCVYLPCLLPSFPSPT